MSKKIIVSICCIAISLQCCGQAQIKLEDKNFEQFVNKISEKKIPVKCKTSNNSDDCFRTSYIASLDEAKRYLGYLDKDYYVTIFDYNMDEDIISNIRQVENPPFMDGKILQKTYIALIYSHYSNSKDIIASDTIMEVLATFTLKGILIDKITIQGHYTRESDWIDFVYLSNNTFKIFHYLPNLENYNIKGGIYYTIDDKKPKTVVEISDYQINEDGKIKHIKTYPKQYLKKFVSFYRDYHADSDDPMNDY